jgi:hypothetical protein
MLQCQHLPGLASGILAEIFTDVARDADSFTTENQIGVPNLRVGIQQFFQSYAHAGGQVAQVIAGGRM